MSKTKNTPDAIQSNPVALLPFFFFLLLFIGSGLYFQSIGTEFAFYQVSSVVAILPSIIIALLLDKRKINESLGKFIDGIGHNNIITMCLIYLLAGAFASVAKATGGVDATVALGLHFIPSTFLLPGFFIITALIATAMGTSMGTLAAVAPIALGVAQSANIDISVMAGTILSGAIFGDNLSIISDTTIAATRTQGCEMKDKFKENILYAGPSALICLLCFGALNQDIAPIPTDDYNLLHVLPYLTILILAISGINVFAVLTIGVLLAGAIGIYSTDYTFLKMGSDIYEGFVDMQEIFLLSMLIGGLAALMQQQGGLAFICENIERLIRFFSRKSRSMANQISELGIGFVPALINLCIANNTVAILISGEVAKNLAAEHNITPKRSASLLDIFACIVQGLLPYGAQVLLLSAAFEISPLETISYSWYCMILAVVTILFILFRQRPNL